MRRTVGTHLGVRSFVFLVWFVLACQTVLAIVESEGAPRRGLHQIQAAEELPGSLAEQSLSLPTGQGAASNAQGTGVTAGASQSQAAEFGTSQVAQGTGVTQQGSSELDEEYEAETDYEADVGIENLERMEEKVLEEEGFSDSKDDVAESDRQDWPGGSKQGTTFAGAVAGSGMATTSRNESTENAQNEMPVGVEALDVALAAEKAFGDTRLEEAKVDAVLGTLKQNSTSVSAANGSTTGNVSKATPPVMTVKTAAAEAPSAAARNSSILTQGAILGSAISGVVKEHSTGIAGVVGVLVAGTAGVGVAFAGISLYKRFKNRRHNNKGMPRIIEIGALSGTRKPRSPSYSRVTNKNQDQPGPSGTRWQNVDSGWEGEDPLGPDAHPQSAEGRQKKAWDWDADW